MEYLTVSRSVLSGVVCMPISKSVAHRAVICSAIARGTEDRLDLGDETSLPDDIRITREAIRSVLSGEKEIFCGESGSTLRFLIPVAAALGCNVVFTGTGRLPYRPLREYYEAFIGKGVELIYPCSENVFLPLEISGRLMPGGFILPGDVSSQYISGLLMALPLMKGDSTITLANKLESSGYVDLTISVMRDFGVEVYRTAKEFRVSGGDKYSDVDFKVEGDYSAAAFWVVANYLGGNVVLEGLRSDSLQGDRKIIEIISNYNDMRKAKRNCGLRCEQPVLEIDASDIPDLVPALCIAAAATDAVTRICKASRLRLKESDRLLSSVAMINAIGGEAEVTGDGIIIRGKDAPFAGGIVDTFSDHRIAMAASVAGTYSTNGVKLTDHTCVAKSYPGFYEDLMMLGGKVDGFSNR
ncbi:MAG: 3-phosphoshikimate 1-carboxyvinyltransferase [Saccharofermentanales bacterium]